jgi:ketosteroid isomerase-like protein
MTSANVALVGRCIELWNRGAVDRAEELARDLATPDFELDLSERVLNPEVYPGHQGFARFIGEIDELWEEMRLEPIEFIEHEDDVLVRMNVRLRGKGSGITMESEVTQVWTCRGGRVSRMKLFTEHDAALRHTGLRAQP